MKKKISKTEAKKQIEDFFIHIKEKSPKEVKKIKRLAMSHNIKLGKRKKTFCTKCFNPYVDPSIRIKNDFINVTCEACSHVARWKFAEDVMPIDTNTETECAC